MSMLERWLPFKFRRKSADEKKAQSKAVAVEQPPPRTDEASWSSGSLGHSMRELFDDPFFREPFGSFGSAEGWFGDFSPSRFLARTDVADEEKALKITVELPGMSKEDLELNVENGLLTIRGEKQNTEESDERGVYRTERYYGYINRSVPLPEDVDQEHAEAEFDKGVLTVRFPKVPSEKSAQKIPIKG